MIKKDDNFLKFLIDNMLPRQILMKIEQEEYSAIYYKDYLGKAEFYNIDICKYGLPKAHYTLNKEITEEELKQRLSNYITTTKNTVDK